jgi:hypothetical protein
MHRTRPLKAFLLATLAFLDPLRNPVLIVVAVLSFFEEAGQHDAWYLVATGVVLNFLAVQFICWLALATVGSRRLWHWLLVDRHRTTTTSGPSPPRPATGEVGGSDGRGSPTPDLAAAPGKWRAAAPTPPR